MFVFAPLHFAPSSYFGSGRFGQPHCSWAAPPPSLVVAVATVKTVLPQFAYSLHKHWNDESSSGFCFDSRYLGPTMDSSGRSGVQSRYTERSDEASNVSTTTVTSKTKTTTTTRTGPPMPTPDYVPLAMASGYVRREEPERPDPEPAMLYLRPGSLGLGRPPTTPGQSPPSGQIQPVANQPAFPPKASSTGKRFYVFRPEHNYGPVVGCGWPLSAALWSSTEPRPRAPEGFRGLEEAVAKCFEEHPDCPEVRIRRS